MTHTETLNILDEIESLVSDQLQVVSYKWLSRNFSLSSNTAKRLLKDFVEKQGKGLEVVYIVSGLLKNGPSNYHARLASSTELPEVEKEFNGKYSVHIYSVQASIPMDPAAIWNTEFVQAEELFRQHSAIDNCLKGNRFCGVSNSCVKRNIEGTTGNVTAPRTEIVRTTGRSNSSLNFQKSTLPSNQEKNFQHSSHNVVHQAKSETTAAPAKNQSAKSSLDKEKAFPVPANKKNGQGEKKVTGTGGLLKNMWGRVPMKTEDDTPTVEVKNYITDHSEAEKPSHDTDNKGGSDDETRDVNFMRAPKNDNRKRKVIFDFSDDEYEDVISLASPSSPKVNSRPDVELSSEDSGPEKPDADREIKSEEPEVSKEDRQKTACTTLSMEKIQAIGSEAKVNPSKGRTTEVPSSPKRKKVLKSRIDDRGREVTEVVWEETETLPKKKEDTDTSKKLNDGKSANAVNRAVVQKKSPAMGNTAATNAGGKAGSKKGGNAKDPKQGNIMSFFKKV
ncbi:hypothetical protein ARALYDRAFT_477029 [Arabidopsis lyrata subsp. lyrata]|uniref:DNA polymerase delta subunit 3 n=1 Tax=Arabidopsis lyrata subsp. lyrata TaxID=81972 RepID=D7KVT7_ARALL|nr:DNA polymerase delta subunit 3 isoform X1 [Arabidopsis lyrata subsp. lyrata]EFH64008.1 hypothetical protein ARALYDRAFT_477029 [Arabidopsis lyrata subsp. lyrata]|eukprot:XP_002887749.1 DNA polymerase delta subunit 3 isoform X1 [Arabidopsis lyrata subsp. lyrata]